MPKGRPQGRSAAQGRSRGGRGRQGRARPTAGAGRAGTSHRSVHCCPNASHAPAVLEAITEKTGIPGWAAVLGAASWLLVLLLWAAGAVGGSFAVFLGTLLSAAVATGCLATAVARGKEALRGARACLLVVLCAAVPVIFDPHSGDVFNLPKYTVAVVGALVLAGLWVVAAVHHRSAPQWRNGLQWLVAALVAWTAVSALAGMDTHVGLLGNYGSYDGLYSAAALGVVMMAAAEAFDATDVGKVLGALGFAGGTVVVLYGLIQLHDTDLHGSTWDFIHWNLGSFTLDIFSTFGNPNHLGGYLAMIFPIVLGLRAKQWPWRVAAGALCLALLAEVARTAARGAWVAVVAATLVLVVFLAPELRRRALASVAGGGAVVVVAVAGIAAFGRRFLNQPLSSLFQSGGTSSVEQRLEIWKAALHIGLNHPITGIGPDTFALVYPQYQSAAWVAGLGPNYLVNGAHDIFMNVLADQGFIGLVLFLALLAALALRSVGAWRRLRSLERGENVDPAAAERARAQRVSLAVVSASITAYVVQAAFNVQQVGLSFTFWLLVGLLAVLAQAAGVPGTLRPGVLLSTVPAAGAPAAALNVGGKTTQPAQTPRALARRKWQGRRGPAVPWPSVLSAVAATVVVVLVALGADGPYRADHDYWAAYTSLKQPSPTSATTASQPSQVGATYFDELQHSFTLNPWEPTYPASEANLLTSAAGHASSASQAATDLTQARALLAKAHREAPLWATYAAGEAQVDMDLARIEPAGAHADLAAAASLARQAIKDNPRDPDYHTLLAQVLASERSERARR